MAVSRGVLSSQESIELLRAVRPPEKSQVSPAGEARWMTDLEVALVQPDAAVSEALVRGFDALALDQTSAKL